MLSILGTNFPLGGWRKVQEELSKIGIKISNNAISNKAGRLGMVTGLRQNTFSYGETASKPDAPQRYAYDWTPLKLQERLPTRPGSMDFATIKSLS